MDIGANQIVAVIASGTTQYLVTYSPVILLVAGFVFSIGIMAALISILTKRKIDLFEDEGIY